MNTSEILQAIGIVGTFTIAIVALWGDYFRSKMFKPKLSLVVNNPKGDLTIGRNETTSVNLYYYHLKLLNKSRWLPLKNCRILLREINIRGSDGVFRSSPLNVPLQYVWAPAEITPSTISIPKDNILDFGCLAEGGTQFEPRLYSYSNNFQGVVTANAALRYSLEVVADNYTEDSYHVFEVSWDGRWTSDPEKMKNHLVFKKIENVKERG